MDALGRLDDGTAYYSPPGALEVDDSGERVRCHLCGSWRRALAGKHLTSHGWTARRYREAFDLTASNPLVAPSTSQRWSDRVQERIARRQAHHAPMPCPEQGAHTGEPGQRSADPRRSRPQPLEHRPGGAAAVDPMGRGASARARHEQDVADRLGFATFAAWFHARRADGWTLSAMAHEAGHTKNWMTEAAVRFEGPASSPQRRLARRRRRFDARARELGYADLDDYLTRRRALRRVMAEELVTNEQMVTILLRMHRAPGTRDSPPPRPPTEP